MSSSVASESYFIFVFTLVLLVSSSVFISSKFFRGPFKTIEENKTTLKTSEENKTTLKTSEENKTTPKTSEENKTTPKTSVARTSPKIVTQNPLVEIEKKLDKIISKKTVGSPLKCFNRDPSTAAYERVRILTVVLGYCDAAKTNSRI